MPRHPPNALKTLDRSHYQWPSLMVMTMLVFVFILISKPRQLTDQERPVSRDMSGCARSGDTNILATGWRPITASWQARTRTNLLFTMYAEQAAMQKHAANFFLDGNFRQSLASSQFNGGAGRDRTDDLLNANQALSQLSYGPIMHRATLRRIIRSGSPKAHAGLGEAIWWAWIDSNYRPHPYQGCALTT